MRHPHRMFAGLLLALAGVAAAPQAIAQAFPAKPIRLIVPYAPGAITDLGARLIAERMSVVLGQQIVIDNRAGAGTRIGMQAVTASAPDGYTLLFANSVTHGTMPAMSKSLPFDPVKDFAPIARVFTYTSVLVCNPKVAANNMQEFIALARSSPGKLTNATAGPGSGHDLMGNLFNSVTNTKVLQVHYRGAAPALQDVLAGTADCIYGGGDVKQYVQAGKLKAFATTGTQRDPDFPDSPTMEEAGVKGFVVVWWQGLAAPAGTPAAVTSRLNAAANEALTNAELKTRARALSLNVAGSTPEAMGHLMHDEIEKYRKIVRDANIPVQD